MSRRSPEAALHGRGITICVRKLWLLGNGDSGHSMMQTEIRSPAQEMPLKEPATGGAE